MTMMNSTNKPWKIGTLNIRGNYLTRIFSINQHITNHPLDLLVITESHFNGKYSSALRIPSLPNSVHCPGNGRNSGGLSIFSSSPISNQPSFLTHSSNFLCCIVYTPLGYRTILGVYNRVNDREEESTNQLIDNIESVLFHSRYPIIIIGDFNLHHPHWNSRSSASSHSSRLLSFLQDHHFHVINTMFDSSKDIATHRQGNVLDLIISNLPSDFTACIIRPSIDIRIETDHHLVSATFRVPPLNSLHCDSIKYRTSKLPDKWITDKANWKLFRESCDFHVADPATLNSFNAIIHGHIHSSATIDALWQILSNIILQSAQLAVPTVPRHHQYNATWWKLDPRLPALHRDCSSKHRAFIRHQYSPLSEQFKSEYRQSRHSFRQACRQAKRLSFTILAASIQQPNNQPNWNAFRRTTGSSKSANLSCVRDSKGEVPTNIAHSLDNISSYLQEVNTLNNVPPSNHDAIVNEYVESKDRLLESSQFDDDISFNEVRRACHRVNLSSAIGPDNISPHFLKQLPHSMHTLLWQFFNYSWTHSLLPLQWKQADVVLIPKKDGDPSDPKSFRPISLTSLVVKMFERIIYRRIIRHVSSRINPLQSGFRRSHSTIDNLYHLTSIIRRRMNVPPQYTSHKNNNENFSRNKKAARGRLSTFHCAFIDLSKAFDRAWHNGILFKLGTQFGITGRTWRWIRSFLQHRSFRVIHGDIGSMWKNILAGVPQGSVLAPLLFLILINDIDQSSSLLHFLLYADDIVAYPKSNDDTKTLSSDSRKSLFTGLSQFFSWCCRWKFCINGPKSGLMSFHSYKSSHSWPSFKLVHPDDSSFSVTINQVSSYNYLGVLFTHNLDWNPHAKLILAKANEVSHTIARVIHNNTPSIHVIRRLVLSCLVPVISYALPIWIPSSSIGNQFNPIIVRPFTRVLAIPWNVQHLAILSHVAVPDFETILGQQAIRVCNRLSRRPSTHHVHPIWYQEVDVQPNAFIDDSIDTNASPLSNLLSKTLYAILPPSSPYSSCLLSNLHSTYRDLLCYYPPQRPPPALLPKPVPLLTRLTMLQQYQRWIYTRQSSLFQILHDNVSNHHRLPHSLLVETPNVTKIRARFRFDHTSLFEPRSRHSKQPHLANNPCPLCLSSQDTTSHYLLRCPHPRMSSTRFIHLHRLHHPILRMHSSADIPDNAIVVFLRHSSSITNSKRRFGCAALINYPTNSILNDPNIMSSRKQYLSATGSRTDSRTWHILNSNDPKDHFRGRWQFLHHRVLPRLNRTSTLFSLSVATLIAIQAITDRIGDFHHPNDEHPLATSPIVFVTESGQFANSMTGFHTLFRPIEQSLMNSMLHLLQQFSFDGQRLLHFLHEPDSTFTWLAGIHSRKGIHDVHPHCMTSATQLCNQLINIHENRHPAHSALFISNNVTITRILSPTLIYPQSNSISTYTTNKLLQTSANYLIALNDIRSV